MNEELLAKLVKLYTGGVKIPGHCIKIPHREIMTITAMAQDQGKTETLKEVFHHLWLSLHTEDDQKRILVEVVGPDRAQVTQGYVLHMLAELYVLMCQA